MATKPTYSSTPYWAWGIERYQNDPEFHTLVCQLEYFLADGRFSIGELKQALTIAAIKFESQRLPHIRPRGAFIP